MNRILSRRERQMEKLELAASRGLHCVTLQLYSSEAVQWSKKGFLITKNSNDDKKFGMYDVSFNFPSLLNSSKVNRYIIGNGCMPENLTYAEILYIKSRKVIFDQSFTD